MSEEVSLDKLVEESVKRALCSSAIAQQVEKAAEKAISESIESAFSYGSEFRKGIKRVVGQILPIVSATDLATFSHAIRHLIEKRLENLASETAAEHVSEVLNAVLPDKSVITIDELKSSYIEKLKWNASKDSDGYECHCDDDEAEIEFAWNVEKSQSSCKDYWDLWMSPDPDSSRYGGKDVVTLRFKAIDGMDGLHECWSANAGYGDIGVKSLFSGPLYGFDALVFRLGTGLAKLKADSIN